MKNERKINIMLVSLFFATILTTTICIPSGLSDDDIDEKCFSTINDGIDDTILEPSGPIDILYEIQKLTPSDSQTDQYFGRSIAIDGEIAVIGAPFYDIDGSDTGAAYVFRYTGSTWVEEQMLIASDNDDYGYDLFGFCVAIEDDVIVVGTPFDYNGSAYIFRYDGSTWVEEAKLTPSDGADDYAFGRSLAISGNTIIIGAPANDAYEAYLGRAYIFQYDGSQWIEEQILFASDSNLRDGFGYNVDIDGNAAVIYGLEEDLFYFYRYVGSTWVEEQKISFEPLMSLPSFVLSGDVCIIGHPSDMVNGIECGSAHILHYNNSTWVQEQKISASDGKAFDAFGSSVAIDDDWLIVGADIDGFHDGSGKAYFFHYNGMTWVEEAKLLPSDGILNNEFGCSVALYDHTAFVGAEGYDAAYVFKTPSIPGDANGDGKINIDDIFFILGHWGESGGPADVNNDGIVDISDIFFILAHWT